MAATRYSEACLVNKMTDFIKLGNIHLNHFPKHEKYGLVYLNQFDHWIKRYLKIKNYVRYVDDMCFIGFKTKEEAISIYSNIVEWLQAILKLTLSKWQIRKIKRGINFVGFRTWRSVRFVRKRSMYNFSKALRNLKHNSLISILGNAKRTATHSYFMMKLKQQGVRL